MEFLRLVGKDRAKETEEKCDLKAKFHREIGNGHFEKKEWLESIINYNKSIACAETNLVLSLGYANRSAVYLEIEKYEDCLKNIQLARKHGYPENKMKKLIQRQEKCDKLMHEQENPLELFQLSYPANPKIPWVVEGLEVRKTAKYGRGIYATRDFKAGDIISMEEPIISISFDDDWFMHCSNCYKMSNLDLIPCSKTASMMFCSAECLETLHANAFNMDNIVEPDIKFLTGLAGLFGGKSKLDKFLMNVKLMKRCSIFDYDWNDKNDLKYRENLGKCLLSLSYKVKDYLPDMHNSFLRDEYPEHIADFLFGLKVNNNLPVTDLRSENSSSISLFHGLINHSCISNVKSTFVQHKIATIVTKPIKAGEQIKRSYTPEGMLQEKKVEFLKSFRITCDCEQCMNPNYVIVQPKMSELNKIITGRNLSAALELLMKVKHFANQENISKEKSVYYQRLIESIFEFLCDYSSYPRACFTANNADNFETEVLN